MVNNNLVFYIKYFIIVKSVSGNQKAIMIKQSAGILLYKWVGELIMVFLVHPGGPYNKNKDEGSWSIPKGEFQEEQDAFGTALREFEEETGQKINGEFIPLNPVRQSIRKIVSAWAIEGDINADNIHSNTFKLEWPPQTGKIHEFPEVDKGAWFTITEAKSKIIKGQIDFLDQLHVILKGDDTRPDNCYSNK